MSKLVDIYRISKYTLVGLINALVNFFVFSYLVNNYNMSIFFAASIGFSFGALISYFLNSKYTFNSEKLSKKIFILFIVLQIIITFIFSILIFFLCNFCNLNKDFAWLISALIVIVLNFKSQKILFS